VGRREGVVDKRERLMVKRTEIIEDKLFRLPCKEAKIAERYLANGEYNLFFNLCESVERQVKEDDIVVMNYQRQEYEELMNE